MARFSFDRATHSTFVEEVLGHGGRGIVLGAGGVAFKRLIARSVAPKLLLREAAALRLCHHPAIPKLLGVDSTSLTLVMSRIPGCNLEKYIAENGPLAIVEAWSLTYELAGTLKHLHACGLYHLDVKPRNVVIAHDDCGRLSVGLVDFGSAAGPRLPVSSRSQEYRLRRLGTGQFRHCPPDQLVQNLGQLDASWDAFGLGSTLFFALTGRWVVENDDAHEAVMRHRYKLAQRVPTPTELHAVIRRLIHSDPTVRAKTLRALTPPRA